MRRDAAHSELRGEIAHLQHPLFALLARIARNKAYSLLHSRDIRITLAREGSYRRLNGETRVLQRAIETAGFEPTEDRRVPPVARVRTPIFVNCSNVAAGSSPAQNITPISNNESLPFTLSRSQQ